MTTNKTVSKCFYSGQWAGANEAQHVYHCACGAHLKVTPRKDPRVGGEVLPGWQVRVPSHASGPKVLV